VAATALYGCCQDLERTVGLVSNLNCGGDRLSGLIGSP